MARVFETAVLVRGQGAYGPRELAAWAAQGSAARFAAMMHDHKALQSGTSHYFGDGFTKAFNITFTDKENKLCYPHQTSWGLSTRVIGGIIMIQGIYRSNFVIIGLPIAKALVGESQLGTVAVLLAIVIPLFNVLAVVTLEVFNGEKVPVGTIILDILKNPLILGSLAGILALVLKLKLPAFVITVLKDMASKYQ